MYYKICSERIDIQHIINKNYKRPSWVAQVVDACLASMRPWVQTPHTTAKKKKKNFIGWCKKTF
jgi:hypothetical protein